MVREHEGVLRGIVCVIEGSGFKAALTRSVLSAIVLLVGARKSPLLFAASVTEGTEWLGPKLKTDAAALAGAIASLRS